MMKRLVLTTPLVDRTFDIYNGSLNQSFTWWEFSPSPENTLLLWDLDVERFFLGDILRAVGSHTRLWLDDWEGIVAPMDIAPQGWTYPSGTPLEPEWWWQWYPVERSQKQLVEYLNSDRLSAQKNELPFKVGIPFQTQQKMGTLARIDAIPMMRLPGLVKRNVKWIFEFQHENLPSHKQ